MKEEIRIFYTALMFYTRIPCPSNIDHDADYINKATRYFPLIGWIVGAISFLFYVIGSFLFTENIAIIVSLIAGVFVTGAFHEDGLADVFDGFGGGWTKEKILDIMKDSRIGAYGGIALIFLFALKFFAIAALPSVSEVITVGIWKHYFSIFLFFVSYHSLARLTAINIVFTSQYSRLDASSKAKPIAKAHTNTEIIGAYFFGLLPLLCLAFFHWQYALVLFPLAALYMYAKYYFTKWIDGYTGDCLGAVEQIAECVCLLSFITLWKFI